MRSLAERLEERTIPEPNSGCLLWLGAIVPKGHGKLWVYGKCHYAHRLAWEVAHGAPPAGLCVLHKCDVPCCCNPNHLFLGTVADNNADMFAKGRSRASFGESSAKARLTDIKVLAIIKDQRPQFVLAKIYGVSRGAICAIKAARSWKHIPRTA